MLAARAYAFLGRVYGARNNGRFSNPVEDILELHHSRIGEHQGRIIRAAPTTKTAPLGDRCCAKKSRKLLRISLTPLISEPCEPLVPTHDRFSEPGSCVPCRALTPRPACCFQGLFSGGGDVSLGSNAQQTGFHLSAWPPRITETCPLGRWGRWSGMKPIDFLS